MSLAASVALLAASGALPALADAPPPSATAAPSPQQAAALLVLSGQGEHRPGPNAAWSALTPGTRVRAAGELRTADLPLRIQVPNGAVIELIPGSTLAMGADAEVLLESDERLSAAHVDLRRGEILVELPLRAPRRAPGAGSVVIHGFTSLVALAQAGQMRARLLPAQPGMQDGMAVAAYEGTTQVASQGTPRLLPAGNRITLRADRPTPPAQPLSAGPAWLPGRGTESEGPLSLVTAAGASQQLSLAFGDVPGATGYEAEIARDEAFRDLLARPSLGARDTTLHTPPLQAGRYFARVRARGADGLPGLAGASRALRIVRVSLPPGGIAEGRTLILHRDRVVTLDDPQGLELSTGGGGFIHAPSTLGPIRGDDPLALRLRLAGEPSSLPLLLVPQTTRAEIQLGPKSARWPADPVEIRVRLVGTAGPLALFEPSSTVFVNLQQVPVKWRREGAVFHATLAPVASPGPWIVRVETTDPHGNELGRGFLEIDRSASR